MDGIGKGTVWEDLKGQIYLGDERFLESMQDRVEGKQFRGVAKAQRRPKRPGVDEIKKAVAENTASILGKSSIGGREKRTVRRCI